MYICLLPFVVLFHFNFLKSEPMSCIKKLCDGEYGAILEYLTEEGKKRSGGVYRIEYE